MVYSLIMVFKNYSRFDGLFVDYLVNFFKYDLIVYIC